MSYSMLAMDIAKYVRSIVRPLIGKSREISKTAVSGDATFSIDVAAEDAVKHYIETNNLNVAYYTEDNGLKEYGNPEVTLIIDPIDGSRPAIAGFENCVVSVAVADYKTDAKLKDVVAGCIYEIKDDRLFIAEKGKGTQIYENGKELSLRLSTNTELEKAAWTLEIAGRPSDIVTGILSEAIDASSIRGGVFIFNSTAYSLTRLVTGQLSAVIDIGARIVKDIPETRERFLKAGFGTVMGLFPYDFAAGVIIAQEAGCIVTDAYGKSLEEARLLESSEETIRSIVAASSPELQRQFLSAIEAGFNRFLV